MQNQNADAGNLLVCKFYMINITQNAKNALEAIATEDNIELPLVIRASVVGGGCAGFSYNLEIVTSDSMTGFDETFDHGVATLCVDPLSYQYLEGTTIDYIMQDYGAGFKFVNPNVTSTCGCGSSFSV